MHTDSASDIEHDTGTGSDSDFRKDGDDESGDNGTTMAGTIPVTRASTTTMKSAYSVTVMMAMTMARAMTKALAMTVKS